MIDIVAACPKLFAEARIVTSPASTGREALSFEGETVLGFLIAYADAAELLARWRKDVEGLIAAHQFALRRAQAKAWNTYVIALAAGAAGYAEQVALSAIEEDLSGTRKIARAGIADLDSLRSALLPLLPIQSAPRLEPVDMQAEIRLRTSELPDRAVGAFLSQASIAVVVQALEELP